MGQRLSIIAVIFLSAALCTVASAADLKLKVVSATGVFTLNAATNTIAVNPNETVTLEWEVSNWGVATKLRKYQVRVDAASYSSGASGSLINFEDPAGNFGTAAFLDSFHPAFVFDGFGFTGGNTFPAAGFRWAWEVLSADGPTDPGSGRYMGTLKLVATSDASGTFVIDRISGASETFLQDDSLVDIPISVFTAANILVRSPSSSCESTGFEAIEPTCGWETSFMCGGGFIGICTAPVSGVCTGDNNTDQNCCIGNPNPLNGWYMSISSAHCNQPHIDTINPATGTQHMRFERDPLGGDPPGCTGFSGACRVSAFTPAEIGPLPIGRTLIDFDIAMGDPTPGFAPFGSSSQFLGVADNEPGSSGVSILMNFDAQGFVFAYNKVTQAYEGVGLLTGNGVYDHIQIDSNPCTNTLAYTLSDANGTTTGQLVHNFVGIEKTFERGIFTNDNADGFFWDIDNYSVVRDLPCELVALRVDAAAGGGDGSTWGLAFNSLQDALAAATSGTPIWVKAGTYKPDLGGGITLGDRLATFQLANRVGVFGGFAGTETALEQRDPAVNVTILSGDILGDDADVICTLDSQCNGFGGRCVGGACIIKQNNDDNSFHVTNGSGTNATAGLDGFTIQGANADGAFPECCGGGMINGRFNIVGNPTITNCIFTGNKAGGAGAMFNSAGSAPTITNCTFDGNSGGPAAISNSDNFDGGTSPTITNCMFINNSATSGDGAAINNFQSDPVVTDCTFIGNSASGSGGAVANSNASPVFNNCRFVGNSSSNFGGAMILFNSATATVTNCLFSGNSTVDSGGAIYTVATGGTIDVVNSTFSQNSVVTFFGGGMFGGPDTVSTVTNCVFWNNSDNGGMDESAQLHNSGTLTANYTLIEGLTGGLSGMGNVGGDPLFLDADGADNVFGTIDDDLRLGLGSPAIDAGDNAIVPSGTVVDLDGNNRFIDDTTIADTGVGTPPIVDMGALEFTAPGPVFVDLGAAGLNDGSSWADAYTSLQDALAVAEIAATNAPFQQVWVAAGTYHPDDGLAQTPGDRAATFQLVNSVSVFGGFAGNETLRSERDVNANVTILSGDLSANDAAVACTANSPDCDSNGELCVDGSCIIPNNNGENSYHVVTGSGTDASAVVDGFRITAGNADSASADNANAAGMQNTAGSPTVTKCTFSGNYARLGGGGMSNTFASPTVTDCVFSGNSANGGGAMRSDNSSPIVTNCLFTSNSARDNLGSDGFGGGMANNSNTNPAVTNCIFRGNAAVRGGAMSNLSNSALITRSTFIANSASLGGGAVFNTATPTFSNCSFIANAAISGSGGAIGNENSGANPEVTNCVFSGNTAAGSGGAISQFNGGSPNITSCTFSGNSSQVFGGGMVVIAGAPQLVNCVFWGNVEDSDGGSGGPFTDESAQIHNSGGTPVVNYSIVMGGWTGAGGTGNSASDPLFVDADGPDNILGTLDDDFRLSPSSPAIDSADNTAVPADTADLDGDGDTAEPLPFDLLGDLRFRNDPLTADGGVGPAPIVDMGAIEFVPRVHVDTAATGTNDGSTWANAFPNLQDALVAVQVDPDIVEIWVAAGTYKPDIGAQVSSGDRLATFQLLNGVTIYGGFVGSETALIDRDPATNVTILSGDLGGDDADVTCTLDSECTSFGGRCVAGACIIRQNNTENSYHVTNGSGTDATAVLDGFTIRAANADAGFPDCCGGGMINGRFAVVGHPTISNCIFTGNKAGSGGGMFNTAGSEPTVTNCTFDGNSAGNGGAIAATDFSIGGTSPSFTNCTFINNSAPMGDGGALSSNQSSPVVTNCTFIDNTASGSGGAVGDSIASPVYNNCTFVGNSSSNFGGAMTFFGGATATVTNCQFSGNSTVDSGGAIYSVGVGGTIDVVNSTFSQNSVVTFFGGGMFSGPDTVSTVTNCVFWNNSDGGGMDESAQLHNNGTLAANYNLIEGLTGGLGGTGNVNADPLFVDSDGADNIFGTFDDDLRLSPGSPAIDAGDNSANLESTDLDGNARRHDDPSIDDTGLGMSPIIDLGAFEFQGITPTGACCDSCTGGCQDGLIESACPTTSTFTAGVPCSGIQCVVSLPVNDSCAAAETIILGTMPFSTSCATNDGPSPVTCELGPSQFGADIWYDFTAPFSGDLEVSACDVNYDNQIAVYGNGTPNCACPADNTTLLLCSDEGCTAGGGGLVQIPVVGGNCYLVRVGGLLGQGNERGIGNVTLSFVGVPSRLFVDASANPGGDGLGWGAALNAFQDALDQARASGGIVEIWVAAGTYTPDQGAGVLTNDRSASFELVNGVSMYGGFSGVETLVSERDPATNVTILSGEIGPLSDFSDNSYNVVKVVGTGLGTLLDGFTITRGNANGDGDKGRGGGLFAAGELTVNNCRFVDNQTIGNGAGVLSLAQNLVITASSFTLNVAGGAGGALNLSGDDASVTNCRFATNIAGDGGAVAVEQTSSTPQFSQCIFDQNNAGGRGGALFARQANPLVASSTFNSNSAVTDGGSVYSEGSIIPTIVNSILRGGLPNGISGDLPVSAAVTYSDVEDQRCSNNNALVCVVDNDCPAGGTCGVFAGLGNIDVGPAFVSPTTGDFRLAAGSPCIDAGDNSGVVTSFDLDGNPRRYEDAATIDTGTGTVPLVDMGAFEFFDCNGNEIPDDQDILNLTSSDCNTNNVPDECEPDDCDGDGIPDECEVFVTQQDCNGDGVCNGVTISVCGGNPDCVDCNGNGLPDACDIAAGTSADCTRGSGDLGDGVPDECEPDCNASILSCHGGFNEGLSCLSDADCCVIVGAACVIDGVCATSPGADSCDIAVNPLAIDCNVDGIPDVCQVSGALSCVRIAASAVFSETGGAGSDVQVGGNPPPPPLSSVASASAMAQVVLDVDVDASIRTLQIANDGAVIVRGVAAGNLTVTEPGGVLVFGELRAAETRVIDASVGQVTIGAGGSYKKMFGAGNTSATLLADRLTITSGTPLLPQPTVELTDNMSITAQEVVLDGQGADPSCGTGPLLGGVSPPPKLSIRNFSILTTGNFMIRRRGALTVGSADPLQPESPTIRVTGDFRNESTDPCLFNWPSGKLIMDGGTAGSPLKFEVAGRDVGTVPAGFAFPGSSVPVLDFGTTTGDSNFSICDITIAAGSNVLVSSTVPNTTAEPGPCLEALYAGTLTLGPSSSVAITNTTIYYATLIDQGGNVQVTGCGGLVPLPLCDTSSQCADGFFCTGEEVCVDIDCQVTESGGGICQSSPQPCGAGQVCDESSARCLRAGAPPTLQSQGAGNVLAGRTVALVVPPPGAVLVSRGPGVNEETALRVRLSSLHHPADPVPIDTPDFSALEGEVRYVNAFRDASTGVVIVDCPDSASFGTTYKCAALGCNPEYLDWPTLFGGEPVHLFGSAIVPDSSYDIAQLGLICQGQEATCASASAELHLTTGRWGDANGSLSVNVTDVVQVVDRVKDIFGAIPETQSYVREETPQPVNDSPNVTDIVLHVDALKLVAYPFNVTTCP